MVLSSTEKQVQLKVTIWVPFYWSWILRFYVTGITAKGVKIDDAVWVRGETDVGSEPVV